MKVKEITAERLKNLGNYESKRLTLTAVVDEKEDPDKAINDLQFYTDYKVNQESRDSERDVYLKDLKSGVDVKGRELTEAGIKQRQDWLDKYDAAGKRATEIEFA
jgi:uncharacterized membrane-anchored protein